MMESSKEKKHLFYMIVLILTFIVMIIGATIAYFSLRESQKDEGTKLYTGKLEINYIDGIFLKNPELWPINRPNYKSFKDVYRNNFKVASSGTLDQTIAINLIMKENEFQADAIKYILFNDKGIEISTGDIPHINPEETTKEVTINLIDNLYLAHDGIASYTLMIWLDNTKYNQNFEMGNKIRGRISILSKQLKY